MREMLDAMGSEASDAEALEMIRLVEERGVSDTDEIPMDEWLEMMREAIGGAAPKPPKKQHTPGPWIVEVWDYTHATPPRMDLVVQNNQMMLATVAWDEGQDNPYTVQEDTARANARLIASAPELLDLCQTVLARLDLEHAERLAKGEQWPSFICGAMRGDLRAVITKATGGAK